MRKHLVYISIVSFLVLGCYDDDISYDKPGEPIPPVTGLSANPAGEEVELSWKLPTSFPNDVIQPVAVQITVSVDGRVEGGAIVVEDNPSNFIFAPYDSSKTYRFTVKVMTDIETTEPYESDLRYSLGETVEL